MHTFLEGYIHRLLLQQLAFRACQVAAQTAALQLHVNQLMTQRCGVLCSTTVGLQQVQPAYNTCCLLA
jgi:hypothetical protein